MTDVRRIWELQMQRMRSIAGILLLVVVTVAQSAAQTTRTGPQLYFAAIGDIDAELMNDLVTYFETTLQLKISVLSPLSYDRLAFDPARSQIIADELIVAVRQRYASLARDRYARVIGITPYDMYTPSKPNWRFTFSLREQDHRFAIVSY